MPVGLGAKRVTTVICARFSSGPGRACYQGHHGGARGDIFPAPAAARDLPSPGAVYRLAVLQKWAVSSAVEHCFHTAGATGSIPVPPTIQKRRRNKDLGSFLDRCCFLNGR